MPRVFSLVARDANPRGVCGGRKKRLGRGRGRSHGLIPVIGRPTSLFLDIGSLD